MMHITGAVLVALSREGALSCEHLLGGDRALAPVPAEERGRPLGQLKELNRPAAL
jgi:hypothetical protein